ncbi:non-homologous end joining protein Ku [Alicyclobacillus cellulosilyticus]|uniref:Non-homologous end joining protein Ku n=1 Tax=Alicyclobacillus cellulosilyticus TaxID=1003997 RepID=A0A917NN95_9BACL|nr:Ku protein [Alicyclobacillus cellulosilyticus]GGJ10556.1 non-homologous end joining protein Ku [Alicyclobacillus cellulosilyticus]
MHTVWKGAVSFGLVHIPVRLHAATEAKDVKFRYLHRACKTPIQYTRTCPACGRPVEWDEVVRGFEIRPNEFVVLEEDELRQLDAPRSRTIDILDFVQLPDIDPIYFDRTYYMSPDGSGAKAYRLLAAAMRETGKIAVAKTVLRSAETLACVRVYRDVLVMETLFWPDEVRPVEQLPAVPAADLQDQELQMAVTLIQQLAAPFQPEKYKDERRVALMDLIARKAANVPAAVARAAEPSENVIDLMQALKESIRLAQRASEPTAPVKKQARRKKTS